jgi:hypothetical protein
MFASVPTVIFVTSLFALLPFLVDASESVSATKTTVGDNPISIFPPPSHFRRRLDSKDSFGPSESENSAHVDDGDLPRKDNVELPGASIRFDQYPIVWDGENLRKRRWEGFNSNFSDNDWYSQDSKSSEEKVSTPLPTQNPSIVPLALPSAASSALPHTGLSGSPSVAPSFSPSSSPSTAPSFI